MKWVCRARCAKHSRLLRAAGSWTINWRRSTAFVSLCRTTLCGADGYYSDRLPCGEEIHRSQHEGRERGRDQSIHPSVEQAVLDVLRGPSMSGISTPPGSLGYALIRHVCQRKLVVCSVRAPCLYERDRLSEDCSRGGVRRWRDTNLRPRHRIVHSTRTGVFHGKFGASLSSPEVMP